MNTIEHGTYLRDKTFKLMHERGVCFTPTLVALAMRINPASDSPEDVAIAINKRGMLPRGREAARRAHQMGVRVIAGSDSCCAPGEPHRIADDTSELVGIGMSPTEAIQAATSISADCLGISKRTGSIRTGLEADLIVLERNPLDDFQSANGTMIGPRSIGRNNLDLILKQMGRDQAGTLFNVFRRFREAVLQRSEVRQILIDYWMGAL